MSPVHFSAIQHIYHTTAVLSLAVYSLLVYLKLLRCREKQRKESARLQTVNRKLSAMNKLLMEENDRLQKQVSHLVYENGFMKHRINTVSPPFCLNHCNVMTGWFKVWFCPWELFNDWVLFCVYCVSIGNRDDHRQRLWICGREWSATSAAKPNTSASPTWC